jgi:hypothetical protein
MASQVEICNRALTLIGEESITSLNDDTKRARVMKSLWETTHRALLRGYRWGFAMARAQLAALSTAPAFGFTTSYQMPTALLRLDMVGDIWVWSSTSFPAVPGGIISPNGYFAVEGRLIMTNLAAPLNIRYVANITDTNQFDALYAEALAAKLAVDACEAITQSSGKKQGVRDDFMLAIREAIRVNAIERPPEQIPETSWIIARR